jgi:hypothetical protein
MAGRDHRDVCWGAIPALPASGNAGNRRREHAAPQISTGMIQSSSVRKNAGGCNAARTELE